MSEVKLKISAQDSASKVLADVRESMTRLEEVSTKVGSALGLIGIAGIGGLVATVRAAVDGVDAFNDLSDATGASIENISALDDVAARTGTSFGTVETALIKFNSVLKDAKPGSDAEAALNALGLSVQDLKNLDPAEALLKTSTALSGFADDSNKARLVQELFGKSAKELAAFLKDLADKGELVAKVTTEQSAEAEKFNKQLAEMQTNVADVTRALSIGIITGLNELTQAFKDGEAAGKGFLEIVNDRYWENVAKVYGTAGDAADGYRKRLAEIDTQLSGGESRLLVRNALLREQADLQAKLAAMPAQSSPAGGGRGFVNPDLPKPSVGGLSSDTKDAKGAASLARSERERALKAESDFRIKLGRDYVIEQGKLLEAENEAYQKWIAETEAAYQAFADARTAAAVQDLSAMAQSNEALALQVQEIGLTTDQLSALKLARMDEAIAQREATLATAAANGLSYEEISALEQKIELLKKQRELTASGQIAQAAADTRTEQEAASKEFASTLRNDVKGALGAALRDTEGEPLQALGDAVFNVLFTRSLTALADSLTGSALSLAGFPTASAGGFDKLFAVLPSFDGGGITGGGARAGGIDGKGGFLSILHPNETVLDHTKGQRGGQQAQPLTVIQNFTVGDVATVSMVRQAVAGSERRIAGAMGRSMSYGGALG